MTEEETRQPDQSATSIPSTGLISYMKSMGPGLVYVLTVLGSGDLVSNSAAGAGYGYAFIWTLALTLVFRFVWVNTSAKYVLVTGESLAQGYARLGRWMIWTLLVSTIILAQLAMTYSILMTGHAIDLVLHLPTEWSASIWSLFFAMVGFVMAYWGGYQVVEKFCKVLVVLMGGSLVVVAVLSKPDPVAILQGTFIPSIPGDQGLYGSFFLLMALIGTMSGSLTNLSYAYYCHEAGWRDASDLKAQRFDLLFGVVCMFLMGALLQIAAAATLHPLGVTLNDADDLVRMFSEVQGVVGLVIFSLGLWGAAFSSLVGRLVGYGLIAADLSRFVTDRSSIRDSYRDNPKRHPVYRACVIFWAFTPLYILLTDVSLFWLVLVVSTLYVVMIPILTPALLILTNNRQRMGQYKNGWLTNGLMIFMLLVAGYITYVNAMEWLQG